MCHLVLYDASCPLCQRMVYFLLKKDRKKCLTFAPLDGPTASPYVKEVGSKESLILVEDSKTLYIEGQAILRLFWHIGGAYTPLGLLSFLPALWFRPFYRWVARHRHKLFKTETILDETASRDRFLP